MPQSPVTLGHASFMTYVNRKGESRGLVLVPYGYVFGILNDEFEDSVFKVRRKYFVAMKPGFLGPGSINFFVRRLGEKKCFVGEGLVDSIRRLEEYERDYEFASQHGWRFVIGYSRLERYPMPVPAEAVLDAEALRKISRLSGAGHELNVAETKRLHEKLRARMKASS